MLKLNLSWFSSLAVMGLLLTSSPSDASNAYSGTVSDGEYITAPTGTTVYDWAIMLSPAVMGVEEPNSEYDNSLLKIETFVVVINQYTWHVVARYKFQHSLTNWRNGNWFSGRANYIMVRK